MKADCYCLDIPGYTCEPCKYAIAAEAWRPMPIHDDCFYLAEPGTICNKCGKLVPDGLPGSDTGSRDA